MVPKTNRNDKIFIFIFIIIFGLAILIPVGLAAPDYFQIVLAIFIIFIISPFIAAFIREWIKSKEAKKKSISADEAITQDSTKNENNEEMSPIKKVLGTIGTIIILILIVVDYLYWNILFG